MFIIGTAGHVDHGKTLLIKALSNITTTHLPEEKKRGMTIDLGFAHFFDTQNNPIGIVDVPGHEKFIRNMTSGLWALDLVLLVVALDDGVMDTTLLHAQICQALGIEKIILVLNKMDLIPPQEIAQKTDSIVKKLSPFIGENPLTATVSSIDGTNILSLKKNIVDYLQAPPTKNNNFADSSHNSHDSSTSLPFNFKRSFLQHPTSFMFIDRSFLVKGVGSVVTGSLCTQGLQENTPMTLLPCNEETTIKSFEAYHQKKTSIPNKSRVAMALRPTKTPPKRGDLIIENPQYSITSNIFIVHLFQNYVPLKTHTQIEVALGTQSYIGILKLIKDKSFAILEFDKKISVIQDQPCLIISHGGKTLLSLAFLLFNENINNKIILHKALDFLLLSDLPVNNTSLKIACNGFIQKTSSPSLLPEIWKKQGLFTPNYFILHSLFKSFTKKTTQILLKEIELPKSSLASKLNIPLPLLEELLPLWNSPASHTPTPQQTTLKTKNAPVPLSAHSSNPDNNKREAEKFIPINVTKTTVSLEKHPKTAPLSKKELEIYNLVLETKEEGASIAQKPFNQYPKSVFLHLVKLGRLFYFDNNLYIADQTYLAWETQILNNVKKNDELTIQDIKLYTGLSRKYIIPILNIMEQRLFVKRTDNIRIVLKTKEF